MQGLPTTCCHLEYEESQAPNLEQLQDAKRACVGSTAMSKVVLYRYKTKDGVSSPVDMAKLRTLAAAGHITPYDHVTRDGSVDWFLASTFIDSFPQSRVSAAPPARASDSGSAKTSLHHAPATAESTQDFLPHFFRRVVAYTPHLIIASVGAYLVWFALETFSTFHMRSIVGGQDASAILVITQNVHWMDWYLPRTPSFLRTFNGEVAKGNEEADGHWHYEVKTKKGEKLSFDHKFIDDDGSTQSLSALWVKAMHARGYARERYQDRPNAILVEHLRIKDPVGETWTIADSDGESEAAQLICLAAMLASSRYSGDVRVLMECDRGTFPYAFAFAAITSKLRPAEALEVSCDADPRKRIFAAEMLLSTLPSGVLSADGFDPRQYEEALKKLAEPIGLAQKKVRYDMLRKQGVKGLLNE